MSIAYMDVKSTSRSFTGGGHALAEGPVAFRHQRGNVWHLIRGGVKRTDRHVDPDELVDRRTFVAWCGTAGHRNQAGPVVLCDQLPATSICGKCAGGALAGRQHSRIDQIRLRRPKGAFASPPAQPATSYAKDLP